MEKKELKEKIISFYRENIEDKEPNMLELIQFVNTLGIAIYGCSEAAAREGLGDDIYELIKKCVIIRKRSTEVNATKFLDAIGYYDKD